MLLKIHVFRQTCLNRTHTKFRRTCLNSYQNGSISANISQHDYLNLSIISGMSLHVSLNRTDIGFNTKYTKSYKKITKLSIIARLYDFQPSNTDYLIVAM